ncbi:MAG: TraB/GumN family protein [Ginsengibacter sp.]
MIKYFISAILVLCLLPACKAQKESGYILNKDANSLLWKVSGNGLQKPSFLFGTFHLLCKDDIHFSDQMKKAIKSSDQIYMEMDMDDPTVMLSGMLYMNMKDGKKLEDLYTPSEYERLQQYFKDSLKMPLMMFQKAKPYFLVALFYPKMMDCKTPTGVEQEIITIAKEDKKEISGLETMQFQASIFDSIPYDLQAKELLKNIDSFTVNKKEFARMLKIYKNQQLDSMETSMDFSEFGGDKFEDILLTNRNKNWVSQLTKTIMPKQSVFVAVGAGHLAGKNGLISLLKKAGYTVEPLDNK